MNSLLNSLHNFYMMSKEHIIAIFIGLLTIFIVICVYNYKIRSLEHTEYIISVYAETVKQCEHNAECINSLATSYTLLNHYPTFPIDRSDLDEN